MKEMNKNGVLMNEMIEYCRLMNKCWNISEWWMKWINVVD